MLSTCGMKEMAQETLEMVTASSEFDTRVKKRKPPRSQRASCVHVPFGSGAGTGCTPSYERFPAGYVESSEKSGRMKTGDSVKERDIVDESVVLVKSRLIKPPT